MPSSRIPAETDGNRNTLVNVLAVAVVIALMIIGVWVTRTIAPSQSAQDCNLSNGSNCPAIYVPHLPARQLAQNR
jgi:hypothetical protein